MGLERYLPNRRQSLADKIGAFWIPTFKMMVGGEGTNSGVVSGDNPLPINLADGAQLDGFGRLRVSNQVTLFDSKQIHDNSPLFWDEVAGGGAASSTYTKADASSTLTVDDDGEYIIRQTKQRMNYQPGKSQQILMTFVLGDPVANTLKRVGYFNSSTVAPHTANLDGLYLEQDGTTQNIVQAKSDGTSESVAQANWNVDPFDGSGPSGITIDWTTTQILVMDFEWLGVGRVRFGFVIDGQVYLAHVFNNANSRTSVYMSSPNHSCRHEIRSTGGTASLVHICASVQSEGGEQALGTLQYHSTDGTHVTCQTDNVVYAIVGVRLKQDWLDTTIRILTISMQLQTSSELIEWRVIINPTVQDTFTYSDKTNSAMQVATGTTANTVTGGFTLAGGYVESSSGGGQSGSGSAGEEIVNALRAGATIAGVADEVVLCAKPIGGTSAIEVEGSIAWRELV